MNIKRFISFTVMLLCSITLSGCLFSGDGKPLFERDVSRIPNPTPKHETPSRIGNPKSYSVFGKRYYVLESSKGYDQKGHASWYGTKFHGKKTSSGETYNMFSMTAAHKTLPIPCYVKVKNLHNNKSVIVKVTDRGPFHDERIIDLSYAAAKKLGIYDKGTAHVRVTALAPYQKRTPSFMRFAERETPAPLEDLEENPTHTASGKKGIYVQLGAFSDKKNALEFLNKAKNHSEVSGLIHFDAAASDPLYRVRLGPFASEYEARRTERLLSHLAQGKTYVIIEE